MCVCVWRLAVVALLCRRPVLTLPALPPPPGVVGGGAASWCCRSLFQVPPRRGAPEGGSHLQQSASPAPAAARQRPPVRAGRGAQPCRRLGVQTRNGCWYRQCCCSSSSSGGGGGGGGSGGGGGGDCQCVALQSRQEVTERTETGDAPVVTVLECCNPVSVIHLCEFSEDPKSTNVCLARGG